MIDEQNYQYLDNVNNFNPVDFADTQYTGLDETRYLQAYVAPDNVTQVDSGANLSSLTDLVGKVIDVGGKTYSDIKKVELQNKFLPYGRNVPSNQSGLPFIYSNSRSYLPQRTPQTGLDFGQYVDSSKQGSILENVASSPFFIIFLIAAFLLIRSK